MAKKTLNKESFSVRNTRPPCESSKYKYWLTCKHQDRARPKQHEKYVAKKQHKNRVDAIEG